MSFSVKKRDNKNKRSWLLPAVVALVFFALGYNSQGLRLPGWLKSENAGLARVNEDVKVDLEELYSALVKNFEGEIKREDVEKNIKKGLVAATGDPYSAYFTAEEYVEFESSLNGKFSGIGAELGKKGEQLVIVAPIAGSPAEVAGLKAGDPILKINGEATDGISVDAAVVKIRGEAGSEVTLTTIRDGAEADVKIVRAEITTKSVESKMLDGQVGYIKISRFGEDTYALSSKAVRDLLAQGATGFVLDLRNNGGGLVDQAVNTSGLWLDNKVVLKEKSRRYGNSEKKSASSPQIDIAKLKTVVLINGGSASASEIVAGALSENGAAKLVGEKTFGKGTVQDIISLDGGSKLKVTIARWFTPNGVDINKNGIKPDREVASSGAEGDEQLASALELLKSL